MQYYLYITTKKLSMEIHHGNREGGFVLVWCWKSNLSLPIVRQSLSFLDYPFLIYIRIYIYTYIHLGLLAKRRVLAFNFHRWLFMAFSTMSLFSRTSLIPQSPRLSSLPFFCPFKQLIGVSPAPLLDNYFNCFIWILSNNVCCSLFALAFFLIILFLTPFHLDILSSQIVHFQGIKSSFHFPIYSQQLTVIIQHRFHHKFSYMFFNLFEYVFVPLYWIQALDNFSNLLNAVFYLTFQLFPPY